MKKFGWIISLVICIVLGGFFGYIYFHDHSYGAAGDDSAGYIYLWGLMSQHQPLVSLEPLTSQALDFFQEEKLARWTTPTHHDIISPQGYAASKYPIGLSLLMYTFSSILHSDLAIYYVLPFFAVLNLILVYSIANLIFKNIKWKYFFSLLAAATVGLANLYLDQTVSQPMREIPSIFFILLAFYLLLSAIESPVCAGRRRQGVLFYFLLFLSAALIGFSFNIRETSLIIIPAFILLFWKLNFKFKKKITILAIAVIFLLVGALPSIINSYNISIHKEKFKKKDITSIAITSNFDHIQSFSLSNLFQNNGKFRPDTGGLAYYWEIMQKMSAWPIFFALVFLGLFYLYKQDKFLTGSLFLWGFLILLLFSLWINPYNRYLLPAFPVLSILGAYGLYSLLTKIVPYFFTVRKNQIIVSGIIILSLIVCYHPVVAEIFAAPDPEALEESRSLEYADLQTLKDLGSKIEDDSKNPLVMFSGNWQYGTSETFSAHTGIQAVRMPLEQKFNFKEAEVKNFMEQNLLHNYQLYIWVDDTTDLATLKFLDNFTKIEKYHLNLSFDNSEIIIYALTAKN